MSSSKCNVSPEKNCKGTLQRTSFSNKKCVFFTLPSFLNEHSSVTKCGIENGVEGRGNKISVSKLPSSFPVYVIRRWRKMKQKMGEVKRAFYGERKGKEETPQNRQHLPSPPPSPIHCTPKNSCSSFVSSVILNHFLVLSFFSSFRIGEEGGN